MDCHAAHTRVDVSDRKNYFSLRGDARLRYSGLMRIIIVGAGMIGIHIARELIEEKRDVVIIEKNPETARRVDNELDCLVINEDGSQPETLRKAGAASSSWFIALTGSDEVNIVACGLVASESPNVRTIARVESPFYTALSPAQQKTFGLDVLINPAMEAARSIIRIIEDGFAEAVVPLHDGRLQLRTVSALSLPEYIGKTLGEIKQSSLKHFLVVAIVRNGTIIVPKGDRSIESKDKLYILGPPEALDSLLGKIIGLSDATRRILVSGSSRIAQRLIEALDARHRASGKKSGRTLKQRLFGLKPQITLIDASYEDGKRMSRIFQDIELVHGDTSEPGILENAGIARADLFIAATESQTSNILTAQLAKALGAKKTIAVTQNDRFLILGPNLDIDSFVSANSAVAAAVLATVRKAHIRTIYDFYEDDVEIVELKIDPRSVIAGYCLRQFKFPDDILVAFIMKNEEIIVPNGETVLSVGDTIGLVARKESIAILESIFEGPDAV